MTQDVLKYLQPNAAIPIDMETTSLLVNALKKALADHAMRETQRLGQEIEQEPVELCQYGQEPASCTSNPMHCLCAIDAALAQPEQEPLEYWNAVEGWVKIDEVREHFDSVGCGTIYKTAGEGREPLYTIPPQRTWVGLTDKDWNRSKHNYDFQKGVDWAEHILKQKNANDIEEKNT